MHGLNYTTTDGFDGVLYDYAFPVPTYGDSPEAYNTLSWHDIDLFYENNASAAVLNAVGFTICLVSFIYVVALTPSQKRRLLIHTFLVLALLFKMIDRGIALALLVHSPNVSAYINLTLDISHIGISNSFQTRVAALQAGTVLTLLCLQICLYLHGKPLLATIRLNHKIIYHLLLTYLITTSVLALALRVSLTVLILLNLSQPLEPSGQHYQSIYQAATITVAVSIVSWSLVFLCSSLCIILRRRKQLVSRNKVYESVLNLIAIIGLESFVLPLAIAIFQLMPYINTILSNSPEVLLIPSVLLVLPLASVFGSSRAGQLATSSSVKLGSQAPIVNKFQQSSTKRTDQHSPSFLGPQDNDVSISAPGIGLTAVPKSPDGVSGTTTRSKERPQHPFEMELKSIDEMEDGTFRKDFV